MISFIASRHGAGGGRSGDARRREQNGSMKARAGRKISRHQPLRGVKTHRLCVRQYARIAAY